MEFIKQQGFGRSDEEIQFICEWTDELNRRLTYLDENGLLNKTKKDPDRFKSDWQKECEKRRKIIERYKLMNK